MLRKPFTVPMNADACLIRPVARRLQVRHIGTDGAVDAIRTICAPIEYLGREAAKDFVPADVVEGEVAVVPFAVRVLGLV